MLTLIHAYINAHTHAAPSNVFHTQGHTDPQVHTPEHMCTLVLTCTLMHIHV